jgi:oligopeptidase B
METNRRHRLWGAARFTVACFAAALLLTGCAAPTRAAAGGRAPSKRIAIVLTNHGQLGDTGRTTGFYLSEATHPFHAFRAAGYEVDFLSPKGGEAPMDGVDRTDPINAAFLDDASLVARTRGTLALSGADPARYDAVLFSGGHGTMWDFPSDPGVQRIGRQVFEQGGAVAAVCHGPAALVNIRLSDGTYLVAGREVSSFTEEEEAAVKLESVVPFALEGTLRSRGARFVEAPKFEPMVAVSGRLVTGQNPASATGVAEAVIAILRGDAAPRPPVARQEPYVVKSPHGDRVDEYYWLRDDHPERKRDEVMDYLRAEQAYTDAMLARLRPLEDRLLAEIRGRIKEDDSTAPRHDRGWWYWTAFEQGDEQPRWMRRRGGPSAPDAAAPAETMLDGNALAKGHPYFRISAAAVSPDGSLVAWTQDTVGRRGHALRFKDLRSGRILDDRVDGTLESVVWANDGRSVYYVRQDPVLLQSGPVCRHVLGTPASSDRVVFEEKDLTRFVTIDATASRAWLAIACEGYDDNALWTLPLDGEPGAPQPVLPLERGVRSYADHLAGRWVIRTNESARNFRLVSAPEGRAADRARWQEILPHRTDASIDGFALLDAGIAVAERVEANARVRIVPWTGGQGTLVPVPESACSMSLDSNPDPANPDVRVGFSSMVTPRTVIDVDLRTGAQAVRKVQPVVGYDASKYASERVWAPSRDGKRIPVSIAWRRDAWARDGRHPMLVEAYGSYGFPSDAQFDSAGVSLMDRGFAIATAHVRGGADLGQDWYEDGRLLRKRNTFNDFVDATEYLQREGWADPGRTFATGGSAGGLLMGAVANMAGDRYRGIGLHVPFVDVLTTMLDASIPLTTNEWTQWGNPIESKEAYEYIRSYSPYDNLQAKPYPAMLVTTGLWDSQVGYFEPAKYVARLRRLRTDREPFLLHVNLEAGHGGKSGRFERLRQVAMEQAFFVDLAGASAAPGGPAAPGS